MRSFFRVFAVLGAMLGGAACARTARDPPAGTAVSVLDSLFAAADSAYRNAEFGAAELPLSKALAHSRALADPGAEARALHWLSRVAWQQDSYALARELGVQALDLQLRHSLTDQLFDSYNVLGLIAYADGRYFDAVERFTSAIQLAEAAGDTVNLTKSLQNQALPLTELGDFAEARRLLLAALPMARALGNASYQGRVLTNLGMLAVRTGNPDDALEYLAQARIKLREADDDLAELNAVSQIGTAYAAIGEPGKAIAHFDSALSGARRQEDRSEEAINLGQLAALYADAGEYPRALRLLDSSRVLHEGLELGDEVATDLYGIAEIYLSLGNLDLARRAAERARGTHDSLGARLAAVQDLLLLAEITGSSGDRQGAEKYLADARREAAALDARSARLAVAIASARMADRAGDARGVLRALRTGSPDVVAGGMDREWEIHALAARAWARIGAYDSAVAVGRRAVAAVERVRGEYGSRLLRTSYLAERSAVYHDLVRQLLRAGRTEEAFAASDGARGRAVLEHLSTIRTEGTPTVRELAEEERQLLRQVDNVVTRIDRVRLDNGQGPLEGHRADLERLYAELHRIRADYSAALVQAEEQGGERHLLAGGTPLEGKRVRAALHAGEALLEYLVGPESLILFVVTRDTVRSFEQPIVRSHLINRVRIVRELTARAAAPDGARGALEALHEILLGAARRAGALAGRTALIVVPHAELTYIPFAALRDRETGKYLVEEYSLLDLPSAGVLPALRDRASRPPRSLNGAVALAPFPRELPAAVAEVNAMRDALPGVQVLKGRDATEGRVRTALRDADLVHLATHGVLNTRSPLFSRVELSAGRGGSDDDGRLVVHEVNQLVIGASLVFLSGCETGTGAAWSTGFVKGEDYATLSRAFLHAGAGNVIATLWRIEDRNAAVLAGHFYGFLAESAAGSGRREGLAGALARAQRKMLLTRGHESPYYWAGFRLSGSGDRLGIGSGGVASR